MTVEQEQIINRLVKATLELNRCLLMAHEAKIKTFVNTGTNTYEQNKQLVHFPWVDVYVAPKILLDKTNG